MPVMDLASTVLDFSVSYTVKRASGVGGVGSDGIFDPPSTSNISVQAMVAPLAGRDLQRLPEGLRASETRHVYTTVELRGKAPGQRPDLVVIDGIDWQVEVVEDFSALGNYWRSTVRKVGRTS